MNLKKIRISEIKHTHLFKRKLIIKNKHKKGEILYHDKFCNELKGFYLINNHKSEKLITH